MLKETITFEDFDGNPQTTTLYFNITKTEFLTKVDVEKLEQTGKTLLEIGQEETRQLIPAEVRIMLDVVIELMSYAYGVRSSDGTKFYKSKEIWDDFVASPEYDAFLMDLFTNPQKMGPFIESLAPKDFREAAKDAAPESKPTWELEGRKPTPAELQTMSSAELAYAMKVQNKG